MKGEEIQAEMIQLLKQQTEAVEKEVFGGLTDTEEQEYGERKERISDLQTPNRPTNRNQSSAL